MRILVLVALVLAVVHAPASAARAQQETRTERLAALESAVVREVNRARTARGLRPLRQAPGLRTAARFHTKAMLDHGFFGHESVDGSAFSDRIGSTHGIRLRIKPPASASASATSSDVAPPWLRASTSSGGRVRSTSAAAGVVVAAASGAATGVLAGSVALVGSGATAAGAGTSGVLAGVTVPAGIDIFTRRVIGG